MNKDILIYLLTTQMQTTVTKMNHIHTQQMFYELHNHCNYSLSVSKGKHQMQWFAIGLTNKCHLF